MTYCDGWSSVLIPLVVMAAAAAAPRAGGKAVKSIPAAANQDNYTQTTADYADVLVEKTATDANARIRNLRWEGGEYVPRPKHWAEK